VSVDQPQESFGDQFIMIDKSKPDVSGKYFGLNFPIERFIFARVVATAPWGYSATLPLARFQLRGMRRPSMCFTRSV
jgi:hypothetical protein